MGNITEVLTDLLLIEADSAYWPSSANVIVVREGEAFSLIDAGGGSDANVQLLRENLEGLGLRGKRFKSLIITHAHPDHCGGAAVLIAQLSPERVVVHEREVEYAVAPHRLDVSFDLPLCRAVAAADPEGPGQGKVAGLDLLSYFDEVGCPMRSFMPTTTVVDGDVLELGRYRFEVVHTPGHAPGHIALWEQRHGVMVSGDLLGEVVPWYSPSGGGVDGMLGSLARIEARGPRVVVPCHGGVVKAPGATVRRHREAILGLDDQIRAAFQGGAVSFAALREAVFGRGFKGWFLGSLMLAAHLRRPKGRGSGDGAIERLLPVMAPVFDDYREFPRSSVGSNNTGKDCGCAGLSRNNGRL